MSKVIKAVFLTLLFIFGITFAMENTEPVVLRYYFGFETPPVPLFVFALFAVLAGVLIAGVGFLFDLRLLKKSIKEKQREIDSLKREHEPAVERPPVLAREA